MSVVYLSGPITGLPYTIARYGWRRDFVMMLDKGIEVLSPMRHEGHLAELKDENMTDEVLADFQKRNGHIFSHPKMIVAKDLLDIKMSDIILVNFLGATTVSKGTIHEMGYAQALGKTIIMVMEPSGNPNDGPFQRESASATVTSLHDASLIINSLLSRGL